MCNYYELFSILLHHSVVIFKARACVHACVCVCACVERPAKQPSQIKIFRFLSQSGSTISKIGIGIFVQKIIFNIIKNNIFFRLQVKGWVRLCQEQGSWKAGFADVCNVSRPQCGLCSHILSNDSHVPSLQRYRDVSILRPSYWITNDSVNNANRKKL